MSEYFIEKGGKEGLYLINYMFDIRHGMACIGYAQKTSEGKWGAECRDVPLDGEHSTRKAAADAVFDYWKQNFSKEALETRFEAKTKGGYRVEFVHGLKDCVVASSVERKSDGTMRRFQSSWKDGKYTCAPDKPDGSRDDSWDLVEKIAPEAKAIHRNKPKM